MLSPEQSASSAAALKLSALHAQTMSYDQIHSADGLVVSPPTAPPQPSAPKETFVGLAGNHGLDVVAAATEAAPSNMRLRNAHSTSSSSSLSSSSSSSIFRSPAPPAAPPLSSDSPPQLQQQHHHHHHHQEKAPETNDDDEAVPPLTAAAMVAMAAATAAACEDGGKAHVDDDDDDDDDDDPVSPRSKYVGVSWCRATQKWQSFIKLGRRKKRIGYYHDEEEAARKYD